MFLDHINQSRVKPEEVNEGVMEKFLIKLKRKGLSTSSRSQILSSIRSFYRYLAIYRSYERDPSELVGFPKVKRKLPDVLSYREIQAILEAPQGDDPIAIRDRAMLEFMYATGLRVSELISLYVWDLDFEEKIVRIVGKGSKERLVPFGERAKEAVLHYLKTARPLLLEKKKKIYLGSGAKEDGLTAQLFKVDRYTGFSSIETPYTSTQLTMHLSKEVTLLMLLGVYSSFVTTIRSEGKDSHYFALFSPDETQKFLMEDRRFVRSCLDIREAVKERFSEILRSRVNELLSIEVSMNLSLIKQMREEKIDKLSLLLFKINKEGQTYKIYEKIPLVIYREPIFLKILERTGKHPGRILERLDKALKPDSTFFRALANRNRNDHENALRAIIGLYRFVVAEDPQGWFIFLRELTNASLKCGSEADRRSYNFVLSGMT